MSLKTRERIKVRGSETVWEETVSACAKKWKSAVGNHELGNKRANKGLGE